MNDLRLQTLKKWLKSELKSDFSIKPVVGDASFRRYFRISHQDKTFIAADAPPDKEDSASFIAIGHAFTAINVNVPQIFSFNLEKGFLLLEDMGDMLYQHTLNLDNADVLYSCAFQELIKIQTCESISDWTLPKFNEIFISQELLNFRHWFLEQHVQIKINLRINQMLNQTFETLIESAIAQPQCCIHRDYHSRNLMVLPDGTGVLDFQDAAWGPITYDAISLLRDCYMTWPFEDVHRWALLFFETLREKNSLTVSSQVFLRWFDWMGIQRHLKAIFIFARKYHRDGVPDYLPYISNGLRYLLEVSQNYPEFRAFYRWIRDDIFSLMPQSASK